MGPPGTLQAIVDRLSTPAIPGVGLVETAARLAVALDRQLPRAAAAALGVLPIRARRAEGDAPRLATGPMDATMSSTFSVLAAWRALNDPTGADALGPLETLIAAIQARLATWAPPAAQHRLVPTGAQLRQLNPKTGLAVELTFVTRFFRRFEEV